MSKFTSLITRAPKRFVAVVVMIAAAIIVPTAVLAWGPDRPTFTVDNPAGYVTFNSITNNPAQGDERNFVQVKEASAADSTYSDATTLTPGKQYTVFVYYHNNAASNLNASGVGVAHGAYVKAQIPAVVTKGSTGTKAVGYVGATNATPTQVFDDISFSNATAGDIALRYVGGSAKIYNKGTTNGATVSDSIVTTGAPLGYNALDGVVKGCNDFAGYVTFNIVADQSNFELAKQVRIAGTTDWKESVNAAPGTTVDYQLTYKNTGTTQQNNVVLKDALPAGLTYVAGSTYLKNVSNPTPKLINDDVTKSTGINIGNYAPNSVAYVKFSAKVDESESTICTPATLHNVATALTNNGSKSDSADVVVPVTKECVPVVAYTCDALSISPISRTEFKFTTKTSQQNATFKNVTYIIRDANGKEIERKTSTVKTLDYTQNTVGKYTVEALTTFTVAGSDKTVTSANCKLPLEVTKTPQEYCTIPGKEHLPKNSAECVETPVTPPVTPPELPKTGMSDNIVAIVGLGALIASIAYYAASRRALNQ